MHAQSTVLRSLHDVGLATWFGGSLMGAVGLNGASQAVEVEDPSEQSRVANAGWSRWTPVNAGAIVAYLAGSLPAMSSDNALARGALTLAALSATGYTRYVGVRSTTPGETGAQRQIAALQWVVPAFTGALLVLNAASGGAQRTSRLEDMLERMPTGRLPALIPALIALGLTRRQFGAKARMRRRAKRGELRVRDIMTPSPECAREHDTLDVVARKMAASDVGAMPVCGDDNQLKGMVTDRDIVVSVVSEGRDPRTITAGELASRALVTIAADDSVTDVIRTMKRNRVRRLPVIENHELVGVVSQADLAMSARDEQVGELVEAISEG